MKGALYRDAHVGLRSRLDELETRVHELEAQLTDAFWSSLDRDVSERLRGMRAALARHGTSDAFADLAHAEVCLTAYHDELARLVERLPLLEEAWMEVPDEAPDPPPHETLWGHRYVLDEEADAFERAFSSCVKERDRDAELIWSSATSCLARFREEDAPFSLRAIASPVNGQIAEVSMWLVTSVARATPPLVVRQESLLSAFGRAIGLRNEREIGDPSFDGLFLLEGTQRAVERLLPATVRSWLLALARFDVPTLEVDPWKRIAQIRWRFAPTPKALDAAVRVLTAIRARRLAGVKFRK